MAATITIEVAAENPPRNASIASPSCPSASGSLSMNRSGFSPAGSTSRPTTAIGSTKTDIRNRYSGNAQDAVARCRSSAFSTTRTWNMRGSAMIAMADSMVSPSQRSVWMRHSGRAAASIRAAMSAGPLATNQTTNTPTARRATSFTTASTAMAVTTPAWRSLASSLRVPNRIVNSASPAATQTAVSTPSEGAPPALPVNTSKDSEMDCSCSAIYGVVASTASTVTSAPSRRDLP